jgi:hypothetical protein
MKANEKWMCYNKKLNHLIFTVKVEKHTRFTVHIGWIAILVPNGLKRTNL